MSKFLDFLKMCPEEPEQKKPEPRRWYIPEDKIEEFYTLYDDLKGERRGLALYRFWNFIYSLYPETRNLRVAVGGNPIAPCVEEQDD